MNTEKPTPPPKLVNKRKLEDRRRFLRSIILGAAMLGISTVGYIPVANAWKTRMRPPGALEEEDFLSSCIKCGQCVQVCPVQAIKLDDLDQGFGIGVPYIDSRSQACDFSCDAVQCILACPTGSLAYDKPGFLPTRSEMVMANPPILLAKEKDPEPTLNLKERTGLAVLVKPEICLARQGKGFKGAARGPEFKGTLRFMEVDRWKPIPLRDHPFELELCDLCVRTCPIKGAISLESVEENGVMIKTPVVHEPCVGCGVCEMVCPTEPAAIVVEARKGWGA
ncbi:MAG: 4Fe-4S dicluster domain-containing protein [Sulfurimicrobium sp.]|jgi:ferredoxin-type protein NapG|nr:4Fe-4S dicluster domain-containing protein [Sulfurimicrobium sp.]MDZ7657492.1 4Fe-4S dicluster domain-containing protein [Sulfurimicrobium sp.]